MNPKPAKPVNPEKPGNPKDFLAWVKPYYTRAGEYWGPPDVNETQIDRLAAVARLCGPGPKSVLELGAGAGVDAAFMADAGHSVVALEFSPTRAPHLMELAQRPRKGSLRGLEADFYSVSLSEKFDVVCYWDGFGVGSDADQRRLLSRISEEWLKPGGAALIDVFNPFRWALEAGKEWILERNHSSHRFRQRRRFDYDPVRSCFVDQWCPFDDATGTCDEERAITQVIRCYSPADLELLLEGTGLSMERMEVNGKPIDPHSHNQTSRSKLWKPWSYLVKLTGLPT